MITQSLGRKFPERVWNACDAGTIPSFKVVWMVLDELVCMWGVGVPGGFHHPFPGIQNAWL